MNTLTPTSVQPVISLPGEAALKTPTNEKMVTSELASTLELSPEAQARLAAEKGTLPQVSQQQADENARAMQQLRNTTIQAEASQSANLSHPLFSDPFTASCAVNFSSFFRQAHVDAATLSDALHDALIAPAGAGTTGTMSMDLAVSQGKLTKIVTNYLSPEFQQQAMATVSSYIQQRSDEMDAVTLAIYRQEQTLGNEMHDAARGHSAKQQIGLLESGNHPTQQTRQAMLTAVAQDNSSAGWQAAFRQQIARSEQPMAKQTEQNHLDALITQWNQFNQQFITGAL